MPKSVFSDRYKALLRTIAAARLDAGLTQAELANRLGRPQSFVSKTETGERRLDFVELVDLAEALNIEPKTLVAKILVDGVFRRS
jgi:transcriptional regulator with XRE-family HTH domain